MGEGEGIPSAFPTRSAILSGSFSRVVSDWPNYEADRGLAESWIGIVNRKRAGEDKRTDALGGGEINFFGQGTFSIRGDTRKSFSLAKQRDDRVRVVARENLRS